MQRPPPLHAPAPRATRAAGPRSTPEQPHQVRSEGGTGRLLAPDSRAAPRAGARCVPVAAGNENRKPGDAPPAERKSSLSKSVRTVPPSFSCPLQAGVYLPLAVCPFFFLTCASRPVLTAGGADPIPGKQDAVSAAMMRCARRRAGERSTT